MKTGKYTGELELLPARAEHAGALARLWLDAFPTEFGTVLGDRAAEFLAQWLPRDPSVFDGTTVARIDDEIVGYIQLIAENERPALKALFQTCRQAIPLLSTAIRQLGLLRAPGCLARFAWMDSEPIPPASLYIRMIGIDSAHRGKGLGSRLLGFAEAEARRRGLARVTLGVVVENPRAKQLYERYGFQAGSLARPRLLKWASGAEAYYPMLKELA